MARMPHTHGTVNATPHPAVITDVLHAASCLLSSITCILAGAGPVAGYSCRVD